AMAAGGAGITAQRLGESTVQPDYDGSPMVTDIMHTETMLELAEVLGERGNGSIQYTYFADPDDRAQYFNDGGMVTRPNARAEIKKAMGLLIGAATIAEGASEETVKHKGRKLADLAQEQGKDIVDTFIGLLDVDDLETRFSITVPATRTPAQQKAMLEDRFTL